MKAYRVYVAGAYSGPDVCAIQDNMRKGLKLSARAMEAGFAVFSPWTDFLIHMQGRDTLKLEMCYRASMAWLEAADAVLVQPDGWDYSKGTCAELEQAEWLKIPVFFSLDALRLWAEKKEADNAR